MSFLRRDRTNKFPTPRPKPRALPRPPHKNRNKPEVVVDLGEIYPSDFIDNPNDYEGRKKLPLRLVMDERLGAARLSEVAPATDLFGKYWYKSSTTDSMRKQLKEIATEAVSRVKYNKGDVWLDIACNDGTMFNYMPDDFIRLGIDPCTSYTDYHYLSNGVITDFFSEKVFREFSESGDKQCKIITCIAMFYDLDDPTEFLNDVYDILDDDGLFIIQMAYAPLMIDQMAFDNICHEHAYYHSLTSMTTLLEKHGFKIVDCSLNETNGGSYRMYIQKRSASVTSFASAPLRDVCGFRIDSLMNYEKFHGSDRPEPWQIFAHKLEELKKQTCEFIRNTVAAGKTVYGYGASTKGNTLLQYFGLGPDDITAIAERAPEKFGKFTVGSNIPIISEAEMRAAKPDYLLVLPWHFIKEFVEREQDYLNSGGSFIVPCPTFEIITGTPNLVQGEANIQLL